MKQTSSIFKGVHSRPDIGKWAAQICFKRKQIHIGVFWEEFDAALAYNFKAYEIFGESAQMNMPPVSHA